MCLERSIFENFKFKIIIMKGFTLIELLVVIGIVVILMTAALVAINPFRQFAQANNAARWSGVTTIMNAVYQRVVDDRGAWRITATCVELPTVATIMGSEAGQYNICNCFVTVPPGDITYLGTMPIDPQTGNYTDCTTHNTGYEILRDTTTGRITIRAPAAQLDETISISR